MLVTCRECGGKVSSNARACPHCGARFFSYPRWRRWVVYSVLVVALIYFFDPIVRYGYWGTKQAVAYVADLWASGGP
ncbi:MAG TPA: hypothetical protein VN899_02245 [Stellaceae bacterium]|jgi:DNA-directed RNA polymerase subunit RPC12/RpoP|nr:hypothetical protein [Stellaceae bacterium]